MKVNGKIWNLSDALAYIAATLGIFMNSQPFYDLIKDLTPVHWTHEHEKHFQ